MTRSVQPLNPTLIRKIMEPANDPNGDHPSFCTAWNCPICKPSPEREPTPWDDDECVEEMDFTWGGVWGRVIAIGATILMGWALAVQL